MTLIWGRLSQVENVYVLVLLRKDNQSGLVFCRYQMLSLLRVLALLRAVPKMLPAIVDEAIAEADAKFALAVGTAFLTHQCPSSFVARNEYCTLGTIRCHTCLGVNVTLAIISTVA